MRVVLDPPRFAGRLAVAAVARVRLWPVASHGALSVAGGKEPLAVLLHDGIATVALAPSGAALSAGAVEALLPGAPAALALAWRDRFGAPGG